ncbi:MAG: hypothetical protein LBM08_13910 [Dysgonamonadaceae bacterium]|jgi:hypothetical protein|nr:hypothetical protein [Dysgonamonadaceae bacterium]
MKNFKKTSSWLLISLSAIMLSASCSKDENDGKSGDKNTIRKSLQAKWISDISSTTYASFEFTGDGYYFIYENGITPRSSAEPSPQRSPFGNIAAEGNMPILFTHLYLPESDIKPLHFGTYKEKGEQIILSELGTIDIVSVTDEEFEFVFIPESGGESEIYATTKAEELIPSSSRTDMLCKTWMYDHTTIIESEVPENIKEEFLEISGRNWKSELEKDADREMKGSYINYSRTGFFTVILKKENTTQRFEWEWANAKETEIYVSEMYERNKEVDEITELSNSKLAVKELGFVVMHFVRAK